MISSKFKKIIPFLWKSIVISVSLIIGTFAGFEINQSIREKEVERINSFNSDILDYITELEEVNRLMAQGIIVTGDGGNPRCILDLKCKSKYLEEAGRIGGQLKTHFEQMEKIKAKVNQNYTDIGLTDFLQTDLKPTLLEVPTYQN